MKSQTLLVLAGLSFSGVALADEPARTTIDFSQVVIDGDARWGGGCGGFPPARDRFETLIKVRGSFTPELLGTASILKAPASDDLVRSPLLVRVVPAGDILDPLAHLISESTDGLDAAPGSAPSSTRFIAQLLESSHPKRPACGGADSPPCARLMLDRFEPLVDDVVIIRSDCVQILDSSKAR